MSPPDYSNVDAFASLEASLQCQGETQSASEPSNAGQHRELVPQDHPVAAHTPSNVTAALSDEVQDLVDYATRVATDDIDPFGSVSHPIRASPRLAIILSSSRDASGNILLDAIKLYFDHFNPLWPMFSCSDYEAQTVHPVLYLTQVSIGSMYGTPNQQQFGTLLYKRLRRLLTASLFDLEGPETDLLWLAHARLLTQVHGLYFGQKQSFSYAQV